ncbi:MAG: tyrosine protein phosphatase [SAR202 cluster bacterium]|nr:tyrosine protein phosphatase [SAR202 cluster bacterium]
MITKISDPFAVMNRGRSVYDLHAHILPGVDDGPKTAQDTLEMARVAVEDGTQVLLATPHRKDITEDSSVEYVRRLIDEISGLFQAEGIELTLLLGMENHLDLDLPEAISDGRALSMNGSRYILVELPFFGRPNYLEDALFKIQVQGFTPVLAHPERIEAFQQDHDLLARFVQNGMLSQITGDSILGHFGKDVRRFTRTLLRGGLVHIIASDTHFATGHRSPKLRHCVQAAADIVGPERAQAMVLDTPRAIVENLPVEVDSPLTVGKSRRWWRFW